MVTVDYGDGSGQQAQELGRHQIDNAATAIAMLRSCGWGNEPAIEGGLRHVEWLARMQRLSHGALVDLAPKDAEVWLDGGGLSWKRACTLRSDEWSGWQRGGRVAKVWGNPDYRRHGVKGWLRNALYEHLLTDLSSQRGGP